MNGATELMRRLVVDGTMLLFDRHLDARGNRLIHCTITAVDGRSWDGHGTTPEDAFYSAVAESLSQLPPAMLAALSEDVELAS